MTGSAFRKRAGAARASLKKHQCSVFGTLAVAMLVGGALFSLYRLHHDSSQVAYGGCPAAPAADSTSKVAPSTKGTPRLPAATLKIGQSTNLAFGRSTQPKDLILYFSVVPPLPPNVRHIAVRVDEFRRSDDATLNARTIAATSTPQDNDIQAAATPDGREIRLDICFGRQGNRLGNPGTYNGSVTLTDLRLASEVSVPVTVTMQYVHGTMLLWLVLLAVIPGAWLLWVTKRDLPDDGKAPPVTSQLFRWMWSVGGLIAVVTGCVAAFSVYVATYLKDPTWGSAPYQAISLYGAMFSAFIATAGIAHAGARHIEEKVRAEVAAEQAAATPSAAPPPPPASTAASTAMWSVPRREREGNGGATTSDVDTAPESN
jgi:hypothetical protein